MSPSDESRVTGRPAAAAFRREQTERPHVFERQQALNKPVLLNVGFGGESSAAADTRGSSAPTQIAIEPPVLVPTSTTRRARGREAAAREVLP